MMVTPETRPARQGPWRAVMPTARGSPATSLGYPRQALLPQGALRPAFQPSGARGPAQEQDGGRGRGQKEAQVARRDRGLILQEPHGGVTALTSGLSEASRAATCSHQPAPGHMRGERAFTPAPGRLQSTPLSPDADGETQEGGTTVTASLRHSQLCPAEGGMTVGRGQTPAQRTGMVSGLHSPVRKRSSGASAQGTAGILGPSRPCVHSRDISEEHRSRAWHGHPREVAGLSFVCSSRSWSLCVLSVTRLLSPSTTPLPRGTQTPTSQMRTGTHLPRPARLTALLLPGTVTSPRRCPWPARL